MAEFRIHSDMTPKGDQPAAIDALVRGLEEGMDCQTLLGVTGSRKTFTMAHVIERVQRPTLVIAHNKTLAAQLAAEFKAFFPENAVEYFVSYYDYYQPEAYIPSTDTYIEKDSAINEEIDRLRHSATSSLLERRDTIVVASVSCIYGLGDPEDYKHLMVPLRPGMKKDRDVVIRELVRIQYNRNDYEIKRNTFRVRGDTLEIWPSSAEDHLLRISFFGDTIERIAEVDPLTGKVRGFRTFVSIFPASHYVTTNEKMEKALHDIEEELDARLAEFRAAGALVEAYRLEQRIRYDLEMLRETGFCKGIENYSRHMAGRAPGSAPFTLIDFFPKDYLLICDESHVSIPQIGAMYNGDRSRKEALVNYGFRLPSAFDNRPLTFAEFEQRMGQALFVSATPSKYEAAHTKQVVEQVIRPTGLVDPEIHVRPIEGQIEDLMGEIRATVAGGERALVLTLTKRMAEDLTSFFKEEGFKVRYLHSDVKIVERMKILRDLRMGAFDILIGINLLREGLDLPEVATIAILDADKEGFLRSTTSLVQIIGRAARNVKGKVLMYADDVTDSMYRAIAETNRRRTIQSEFNAENGIVPTNIHKDVRDVIDTMEDAAEEAGLDRSDADRILEGGAVPNDLSRLKPKQLEKLAVRLEKEMKEAARKLAFEEAARLRDLLVVVRGRLVP